MKKLLLFCLLSVFMSMTYIANAQSPGSGCCFWLEDINSSNPAEKYNLTLPYASNDYVYYYFKFDNSCGLDLDDKISIDWEITRNGVLIDNNLNQNLLIQIETFIIDGPQPGWVPSGQLRSGIGSSSTQPCPNNTDYPGGLGGPTPNTYCNVNGGIGYFTINANNLYNYFYVHFLQYASDNNLMRIKIKRVNNGDFKLKFKLIERLDGTQYENFYLPDQNTYYGGKLATKGVELGSFTLEEQTYLTDAESACSGVAIEVGRDPQGQPYSYVMSPILPELSAQMVVDVPFYNTNWTCVDYIDSMVTYTLTWAAAPAEPNVADQTRCGAGTITFTGAHSLEPGIDNLIYRWYDSADLTNLLHEGNTFTTPELAEDQEISYWVTASIVTGCEGLPQEVTAKAFKQPTLTLTNPTDLCPVAGNKTVTGTVGNIYMEESSCDLSIVWTGATSATANCTTFTASVLVTNDCNATYPYSATLTDNVSACSVTANGSFTLVDEIAPAFTAPADYTAYKEANCVLVISPETTGFPTNILDNCSDPNFVISSNDVITPGSCSDNYTITRTWSVADHCGNATTHNQTILVRDIIAPTFTVPAPITIYKNSTCGYDANVLITGDVTDEADNCTTGLNAVFTDAVAPGSCTGQQIITRTWTLTDACLNVTTKTQIITAIDTTKPTFTVPGPVTIYKDASCGYNANVTITGDVTDEADNCSTGLNAVFTDAVAPGSCQGQQIITRTWTLTDACNNVTSKTQIITAIDTTKPTFTVPGPFTIYKDATCGYNANVSITGDVTNEADNCSTGIQAVFTDAVAAGTCQGQQIITRTWTLTDYCGNTTTKTQIITAIDTTRPTFTVPGPVTIYKDASCAYNASVSITGDVTDEADNCSTGLNAVFSDVVTAGSCQGQQIITRTWTLTDACNNVTTKTQIITAIDTTKPTFTVPGPVTIYKDASCGYNADVTVTGDVTDEADNCSTGLNAVFTDAVAAGTCQGQQIITRTWTLTDACNNVTTKTQIITAIDTTKPTFTVPGPVTIYKDASCGYNANVSITGDVTDEADNCSTGLNAVYTDAVAAGTCQGQEIITRSWTLTDACGNTTTKEQIITALDNTKPTFTAPADLTIYKNATCGYDATITVTGDVTNEADNCSTGLQAVFTDTEAIGSCPNDLIITRTWTLTDACANVTTHVQTITVSDNLPPTFTVPANITIYKDATCNHDASVAFTGDVTDEADNCSTGLNAVFTDATSPGACPNALIITRTWTLTDNCSNSTSHVQVITITDNTKPTFTVPADIAICKTPSNTYDAATTITGNVTDHTDNCTAQANLVVNYSDVVTLGTATEAGSIVRTWTVTDACLNTETKVQTITLNPAPVATMAVSPTPDFCLPETGEATITATLTAVTVGSYTYQITLPNSNVVNAATATYNVSTPNTYTFSGYVVNTTTNCASAVSSASTVALLHPDFTISNVINKRGCRDDVDTLNGSFTVSNFANYTFSINPNVGSYSNGVFSNLPIGTYQVTAEHTNGCSITKTQEIVFSNVYTPLAEFKLGGRDADTAICWISGLYLNTSVSDLNRVSTHQYNYHIIVPVNVTANGNSGVTILQPGIYQIGGIVENITTGCRDTSWHYVYAMAFPVVDVTSEPFCLNTNVDLTMTAQPVLVDPHSYTYAWTSVNTGTDVLGTNTTLSHPTLVSNKYYGAATAHYAYTGENVFGQTLTFNLACTSKDSLTVAPLPLPVFEVGQIDAKRVCNAADPGQITIGTGWNALNTWTLTRVATGATTSITTQTFTVPDSGYYHITAVDPNGCSFTLNNVFVSQDSIPFNAVVHADIQPLVPLVDKSMNLSFCWDHSQEALFHEVRYTNDTRFSYQYSFLLPTNINPVNSDSSYVTAAGTYLLRGYVKNLTTGCVSNIDSIYVYAVPTPDYRISPPVTICAGTSVKVGITPISTFTATWGTTPTPTNGDSILITPTMYGTTTTFTMPVTISATLTGTTLVCSADTQVVVTINNPPIINVESSITPVSCFGGSNGTIAATADGTGTLSYKWSNNATTATITGLAAGSYTLTVTDPIGCTDVETFVVTQPLAPLAATASQTQAVSCFGGNNGIALASATGGTGPYTYTWPQGGHNIDTTGLLAGVYTVTVTDAKSCIATASVTITEPTAPLSAAITAQTNVLCFGASTGSATVTPAGGTEGTGYLYNWGTSPVQTTATASGLSAGIYNVTVTDGNGCTTITSATITQPATAVSASITSQTNVLCFGASTGSATVTPAGGTEGTGYLYNWGTSPVQTTATASGLSAGTYNVTVTDGNGCTTVTSATITQPATAVSASITSQTNVLCFGASTGSATVTPAGGTEGTGYLYNWGTSPVQTTATASGLSAGTYNVTVTDGNGCTTVTSATITQPATAVSASITSQTNVLCFGASTGSATVTPAGGTEGTGYLYNWGTSPVQTTATASGLSAGTYNVTVTDGNGCTTVTSATITQPATAVSASITSQTNVLCFGASTGSATVTPAGGTEGTGYLYNWGTSPVQTTATASGLSAGTYNVTVTDGNGCTTVTSATITQPATAVSASITSQTNVLCFGASTGSATVTPAGGTEGIGYLYNWGTSPVQTTATASGLSAGTYNVTVTDGNGCTTVTSATITQPATAVSASITSQTNVLCFGASTGSATVTPAGGTEGTGYLYNWGTSPVQTTATASGLSAGTYNVTVTDGNGCTTVTSATITQPATAVSASITSQTNVLCFGASTGSATVTPAGGTEGTGYLYNWGTSPVQTTATASGLSAGTYNVTVTDGNGCTTVTSATITQPATAVSASITSQTNVLCFGASTGSATVTPAGGTEGTGYLYNWGTSPVQTTATASGLSAGTYNVTVTDGNGCTTVTSATITQPATAVSASITSQTNVLCFGASTGSATVTPAGGTEGTGYLYNWGTSPVQTTATASGLSAGTYNVTVTDGNGCTTVTSATITQPATAVSASITSQTNVLCFGASTGSATVTPAGGTEGTGYLYNWGTSPVQTTATASGLSAGTYNVTVTDGNGCTTVTSATITQPATAVTASITSQTNVGCFGASTGSATVTPQGGTVGSGYSYLWSNTQTTQTAVNLAVGTYNVTVTDGSGCTTVTSATITQPDAALSASTSVADVKCFGGNDGSASVTVTGGTIGTGYSYSWNTTPVQNTQTAIGLSADSYIVIVTDANGCTTSATAVIGQPAAVTASISPLNVTICSGTTTGVNLNAGGGTTPRTFLWSNDETTEDLTGVVAGTYTVTVTDNLGCAATASTTISYYDIPTITTDEPVQVCLSIPFTVTASTTHTGTWSAQAFDATTNAAIGSPVASNAYTYSSATPDTIFIVYTFISSTGTCTYKDTTNDIKISGEPRLNVYRTLPEVSDNYATIGVDEPVTFHFMVDNTCAFDKSTRLSVMYTIRKDGNVVNDITPFVSNTNSIRYQMDLANTGIQSYYPPFNYTSSLSVAPAAHFPLATSTGAVLGSYQFDFFSLAYFENREGTVSISNFIQPGVYTIEYALVTNYNEPALLTPHGNEIGVITTLNPARLGGNQFYTGTYYTKVWSTNTMTITVVDGPPTPIAPQQPVAEKPMKPEASMKVYPNPSSPGQTIYVEVENVIGDAVFTVSSVSGSTVDKTPVFITENQKQLVYNLKNIVPGIYFITLTSKDAVLTKKIIIQPR